MLSMKRFLLIAMAVVALMIAAPTLHADAARKPTPAPIATPLPPEDPAITAIARKQFVLWQAGVISRDGYTDEMNQLVTPDKLAETSKELGHLGGLLHAVWAGPASADDVPQGSKTYVYHMVCSDGAVYMEFSIEPTGKIAGMLFRDDLADF
jgi:hypothetical protein